MVLLNFAIVSALLFGTMLEICGHGMLMNPVNRGSAWRMGYSTPRNYDDNGNNCGGFGRMWNHNHGRCGVCGDDYSLRRPRPNENTGTYGTRTLVATYDRGSYVNVTAKITANHRGHFEFFLCPLARYEVETENCFARYPLRLVDGKTAYRLPSTESREYTVTVKLPNFLTCAHCSLRWQYVGGNNWGRCPDGTGALGCGPQEVFRTCSDIGIRSSGN